LRKIAILFFLLFASISFALCQNVSSPVVAANGREYPNESAALADNTAALFCGTLAEYQAFLRSELIAPSNTSQLNTSNVSYLQRFVSYSFTKMFGGDPEIGNALMALIFGGGFFAFILLQNTRFEGKIVVLIPVMVMTVMFFGWARLLLAIGVGIIIYLGLGKIINK
jgi:predicted PurR-regulated permease PerM